MELVNLLVLFIAPYTGFLQNVPYRNEAKYKTTDSFEMS
jgi:hypothetical protein